VLRNIAGGFDAVFIAIGAHLAKHVEIPGPRRRQSARRGFAAKPMSRPARTRSWAAESVIYGGGNTANRRRPNREAFGSDETSSSIAASVHMTATEFETEEASAEGIKIKW